MILARYPNPIGLAQQINDLIVTVARHDADLEHAAAGRMRVGVGWDTWCANTSASVQQVRDSYVLLRPAERPLIDALGFEVRDLARIGGRLGSMRESGAPFGSDWGAALDSTLATLRGASSSLLTPTPWTV